MKIDSIELKWFRGAGKKAALELACKSAVVYGGNGAGKSSFVDGVEYAMCRGKVSHLAHEYSGSHQTKGVINTHRPDGEKTSVGISFGNGDCHSVQLENSGKPTATGNMDIQEWEYHRTILRQAEVTAFIHDTKGDKYSTLLPLLGLSGLEYCAKNLEKLSATIGRESDLFEKKARIRNHISERIEVFDLATDDEIGIIMGSLHKEYLPNQEVPQECDLRVTNLVRAIKTATDNSSFEARKHVFLERASQADPSSKLASIRSANEQLAEEAEPLIKEKLEVLKAAESYSNKLDRELDVDCPACGRQIEASLFLAHVESEHARLEEIGSIYEGRSMRIVELSDSLKDLQDCFDSKELQAWVEEHNNPSVADGAVALPCIDAEALRTSCTEDDLLLIETKLKPLIEEAVYASKEAPPEAKKLSLDNRQIHCARTALEVEREQAEVTEVEELMEYLGVLEKEVRVEIGVKAGTVIREISSEIREMWAILHPDSPISRIRLEVPANKDKAIDICLTFFGVEQESPRLTLSEGYRNSLGLCVFLAMAKRDLKWGQPLFLDDVVISMDREHRGMVASLLEKKFSERQVIVFTHDRVWYTELSYFLTKKSWVFLPLLPYESPDVGIQWAKSSHTFDEARGFLQDRPDTAGAEARKIMDIELPIISEKLGIRLPFRRGHNNDRRMANEFLERLIADGKKKFEIDEGTGIEKFERAIHSLEKARGQLLAWGNPAAHTKDLVRAEAETLINTCEEVKQLFSCTACKRAVFYAEVSNKHCQCECGSLRWKG